MTTVKNTWPNNDFGRDVRGVELRGYGRKEKRGLRARRRHRMIGFPQQVTILIGCYSAESGGARLVHRVPQGRLVRPGYGEPGRHPEWLARILEDEASRDPTRGRRFCSSVLRAEGVGSPLQELV